MNEIIKRIENLPDTIQELSKFVLIGREALNAVRAEIRAIDKIGLASDVREQKLKEGQMLAEALLDAEVKIGELLNNEKELKGRDIPGKSNYGVTLKNFGITKNQSSKFQQMFIHKNIVEEVKAEAREKDELPTRNEVLKKIDKPHISYNSGENEWYTPRAYIVAARNTMGSIDLDPASSDLANQIIKADKYFTDKEDGLKQKWFGNVWMNPPYSQPLIDKFSEVITIKYIDKEIVQACILVNNATETEWFQRMLNICTAICFIKGRVKFIDKNGNPHGTPLQGQVIIYMGNRLNEFKKEFEKFGIILWKHEAKLETENMLVK